MPLDEKDQQRMERQIRAAFRGVSRANGVSWTEAGILDGYGTDDQCRAARSQDTDRGWEELVDDARWEPDSSWGGFPFLDAIGFRYYLAPAMIRAVRSGQVNLICFHLTLRDRADQLYENQQTKWAMLDSRQRDCIVAFLKFMAEWADQQEWGDDGWCSRKALASHARAG